MDEQDRRNSFDLLRLFAAFCVFFGHQIAFHGHPEMLLGLSRISLASIGLYIFFALSGYLVAQSLVRAPEPSRYFRARALRIFPGAAANVAFCIVLGACITTLAPANYFSSWQTWKFAFHNTVIVVPPTQLALPGVLENARWPVVNGSIWTLKYELLCYAIVFALFWIARLCRLPLRPFMAVCAAIAVASYIAVRSFFPLPQGDAFFTGYTAFNTSRFVMTFLAGAFVAAIEPSDDRKRLLLFVLPAILVVAGPTPEFARAGVILLLTLLVIEIGRRPFFHSRLYSRIGDLSYGTFLYAYPIQNALVTRYYDGTNGIGVTLAALGLTLGSALLSWHIVEKPALRLKRQAMPPVPNSPAPGPS